jgi:hypothetical protein
VVIIIFSVQGEEGNRWRNLKPGVGYDGMAKLTMCSAHVPVEFAQRSLLPSLNCIDDLLEE